MQLGISSYTYGWNVSLDNAMPRQPMDEIGLVSRTLDFGLKCLQIGDNLPVNTFSNDRKRVLKELLSKHRIRFEIGARNLTAKHLEEHIELCRFMGAPLLRFVTDCADYEPPVTEVVAIVREFLPELIKNNITLGIENHDRFKARELASMMEAVGSERVGICLDCVNSVGAGEGLVYVAGILVPYTVNLHIKDFTTGRLPHKMGFITEGAVVGKGMTDLPWLLEKIHETGRCQSAILEQWVPPEADMEVTCSKEILWAAESLKYIKNVFNQY